MTTKTSQQRAADKAIATANEIIEWVETSGVSYSPSTVRYELAKALMSEASQGTIRRLHEAVRHLNAKAAA